MRGLRHPVGAAPLSTSLPSTRPVFWVGCSVAFVSHEAASSASPVKSLHQRGQHQATQHLLHYRLLQSACPTVAELSVSAASSASLSTFYSSSKTAESESERVLQAEKFVCRERIFTAVPSTLTLRLNALRRKRYSCADAFTTTAGGSYTPHSDTADPTPALYGTSARQHPVLPAPEARAQLYEPFPQVLHAVVERHYVPPERLVYHPEAPCPAAVLLQVMALTHPSVRLTRCALEACIDGYRGGEYVNAFGGTPALALQRVAQTLRRHCPSLYCREELQALLLRALVGERLFTEAAVLLKEMGPGGVSPDTWSSLVEAAAHSKLPDSHILWVLLREAVPSLDTAVDSRTAEGVPSYLGVRSANVRLVASVDAILRLSDSGETMTDGTRETAAETQDQGSTRGISLSMAERRYELEHSTDARRAQRGAQQLMPPLAVLRTNLNSQLKEKPSNANATGASTDAGSQTCSDTDLMVAIAVKLQCSGVLYGLSTTTATQLLLRAGTGFGGLVSPILANHIIERYVKTCTIQHTELERAQQRVLQELHSLTSNTNSSTTGVTETVVPSRRWGSLAMITAPHPSPFFVLFRIIREARDSMPQELHSAPPAPPSHHTAAEEAAATSSSSATRSSTTVVSVVHWRVAWRRFQQLNRANLYWLLPEYHAAATGISFSPSEAEEGARDVLDVLARGANPWMCLNVARVMSAHHLIDGLEAALWLLHRLDPLHHTTQAKEVTRKVFQWLLTDVGVHLQPQLHVHLIPAARVLIRLNLQEDLRNLYNVMLDHHYAFSPEYREEFMRVMADLVCPMCSALLLEDSPHATAVSRGPPLDMRERVFLERRCLNCLTVVPPKEPGSMPSFALTAEHITRIRVRRRALAEQARRRQRERAMGMESKPGAAPALPSPSEVLPFSPHAAVLLPGVPVSLTQALFGAGDGEGRQVERDVQIAMKEAGRRLELHRAARSRAIAVRGGDPTGQTSDVPLLAIPSSASQLMPPAAAPAARAGPWVCVWCREQHQDWEDRVQCRTCGAETGPDATWRAFGHAADAMTVLRTSMRNALDRPSEAIVSTYLLMVYCRTFLLRSIPHDHQLLHGLLEVLVLHRERVLAGYVFTRFLSPLDRLHNNRQVLYRLAALFHGTESDSETNQPSPLPALEALSDEEVQDDETLLPLLLTPQTCKMCFGSHDWHVCPILTRNFSHTETAPLHATQREKLDGAVQHLKRSIRKAERLVEELIQTAPPEADAEAGALAVRVLVTPAATAAVASAYTTFISSPFRPLFAEENAPLVNVLCVLLARLRQFRRAAFVLCHIPLNARENRAYQLLLGYFQVEEEPALRLLAGRPPLADPKHKQTREDGSAGHPNFMQVTQTCCICLEDRHASVTCPRLQQWLSDVLSLRCFENRAEVHRTGKQLLAQVSGWIAAGTERLQTFYRFLVSEMTTRSEIIWRRNNESQNLVDSTDPLVFAIEKTILALLHRAECGSQQALQEAKKLFASTPCPPLSREVIQTMLVDGAGFSLATAEELLSREEGGRSAISAAATAAVPLGQHCLMCFQSVTPRNDSTHTMLECPQYTGLSTLAQRITILCEQVGNIKLGGPHGVLSAAASLHHLYNEGKLWTSWFRQEPAVAKAVLELARRCLAARDPAAGVRLVRLVPVEMIEPEPLFPLLWRSAGLVETEVDERTLALLSLYDAEGLKPSIASPPPRRGYSSSFIPQWHHVLYDGLCRHCLHSDHHLTHCPMFREEVNFGRDFVAAYRMSMISEQLESDWQDDYLLRLLVFFASHRVFMPYHITGVANALNAMVAMWCFRGEAGIALQMLLWVPPAYRRAQTFRHVLHALHFPPAEITKALSALRFSPPASPQGSSGEQSSNQHSLLSPKPAFRDEVPSVVESFPAARQALAASAQRMQAVAARLTPEEPIRSRLSMAQQFGGIEQLREDFDPVLTRLEEALGMKLGSRHALFTSAIDLLEPQVRSSSADAPVKPADSCHTSTPGAAASLNLEIFPLGSQKARETKPALHSPQRQQRSLGRSFTPRGRGRRL